MGRVQTKSLLEYVRGVLAEADVEDLTDRELLRRFSSSHDETAFKAIVRRHGPMVLRICRRILARREDAEDAFQATFLVLARKADSLKWRESIGAWLYEVAHRLGMEARRKEIGRQFREAAAPSRSNQDPLAEINGRELVGILDKEVAAMPERYRAPLLFHLEGKGDDEAAHLLGCSLSTLKRRLRHARQMLKTQLERRGFTLSVGLSALILCNAASASISPSLVASTVAAVALQVTGKPLAVGVISAQALCVGRADGPDCTTNQGEMDLSRTLSWRWWTACRGMDEWLLGPRQAGEL